MFFLIAFLFARAVTSFLVFVILELHVALIVSLNEPTSPLRLLVTLFFRTGNARYPSLALLIAWLGLLLYCRIARMRKRFDWRVLILVTVEMGRKMNR